MRLPEIELTEKIVPDAYHGTSKRNAANIAAEGFRSNTSTELYYGDGVYFYESSRLDAEQWAQRVFGDKYAVIRAVINLGRCLDLLNAAHVNILKECRRQMEEEIKSRARYGAVQEITDTLIINLVANLGSIDTVRAGQVRVREKKIFRGSHVFSVQRLIIVVRNLSRILSVEVL